MSTWLKTTKKSLPVIITVWLAGCALNQDPQQTMAAAHPKTDDYCEQLDYIFSNSSDGFKVIRTQPNYQNKITLWKSTYQPLPVNCEIWQWSNRYSYVCSQVLPDQQSAMSIYDEANKVIKECVKGNQVVQRLEKLPDEKGEKTEYLINDQVRGSTQLVNTRGLFSDDWTVYVLISSPDTN